jgi:hypothetical protein
MIQRLLSLFRNVKPTFGQRLECGPGRQIGVHGRIIKGLGGLNDSMLCTRCGYERYEERWSQEEYDRAVPAEATEAMFAEVMKARSLPGGIYEEADLEAIHYRPYKKENT